MVSRERVQAALRHTQPDRAPIGLAFVPELRESLKTKLGFDDPQLHAWVDNDLAFAGPTFKQTVSEICYADPTMEVTGEGWYLDIYRVPFRQVRTELQTYVELAGQPPLREATSIQELETYPWPSVDWWDYSGIRDSIASANSKAIIGHSRGFFEIAHFMRGMEAFMMDLALNPDFACRLMDHIADYLLERTRRILEAGQGGFTIFEYNDDIASQNSLFISPGMWRKYNKPRMAKFCNLIHSHGAKVQYHSCGSVREVIPDLIEIGVDILNPVQPLAKGMAPFELKREFGNDLVFHGGIDIQNLLPHGSVEQVRESVRKMIDVVGRGGGFILSGSHTIQADTPIQNIIAMLEEAKQV